MWAEKVYRDQRGRCAPADGGARQPEACVGCSRSRSRRVEGTRPPRIWPGARAYRASRAPLWALRLAGTGAESGRRGCVRQQRRGLEIAWTSGICVALQRMRRFRVRRVAGSERKLASLAYTTRSFESPTSPKCDLCGFCEFRTDRLDRLRDFGRDRRAFPPTNSGARPIWSGRTSFR